MANYIVDQSGRPTDKGGHAGVDFSALARGGKKLYILADGSTPEEDIQKTRAAWGIDPKTKKRRMMRYLVGATTVWLDEQKKKGEDTYNVGDIVFTKGRFQVDEGSVEDMFLSYNINNTENGGTLYVHYDPMVATNKFVDEEDMRIEAQIMVRNKMKTKQGIEELRAIARGMHLPVTAESTEKQIKEILYKEIKANCKRVVEAFDDKMIKAQAYVEMAVDKGEIVYTGSSVRWAGGEEILAVPQGRDWKKQLAALATEHKQLALFKELDKVANS